MTAFDTLAHTYDHDFTHTPLGLILRQKAQARLQRFLTPDVRILELGCGTGEDARWIGEQGLSLIATDASTRMCAQTQAKTQHLPHVQVERLDMNTPPADWPKIQFDLVFSHFGALNCVDDVQPLVAWLTPRVPIGGHVCLMVMSPACLWEQLWYLARANPGMAFRRRHAALFRPDPFGRSMTIIYPAHRTLAQAFAPQFRPLCVQPMGLFIPPSELFGMVEKRPRFKRVLLHLEQRFGDRQALALWADHYTLVLERV